MKKNLLFFISLILFMPIFSNGEIFYYTQSNLFVGEIELDIPHGKENMVRPFIILPNRSLRSSDQQLEFLRSIFNSKEIILRKESKELKWEPQSRKKKKIFPRIVQTIEIERNKYEITLIPVGEGVSIGFRIQISQVKPLSDEDNDVLSQLMAVYDETSEGRILNTEIMNFGNLFYICFPLGKKTYIISFYQMSAIGRAL